MVLSLQGVYAPERRNMSITIRTHRDNHAMAFIAPNTLDGIKVNRWPDAGSKCTEINITSTSGKSATLYLEDISGHLIASGNIEGGKQKFAPVGGNRDFVFRCHGKTICYHVRKEGYQIRLFIWQWLWVQTNNAGDGVRSCGLELLLLYHLY